MFSSKWGQLRPIDFVSLSLFAVSPVQPRWKDIWRRKQKKFSSGHSFRSKASLKVKKKKGTFKWSFAVSCFFCIFTVLSLLLYSNLWSRIPWCTLGPNKVQRLRQTLSTVIFLFLLKVFDCILLQPFVVFGCFFHCFSVFSHFQSLSWTGCWQCCCD